MHICKIAEGEKTSAFEMVSLPPLRRGRLMICRINQNPSSFDEGFFGAATGIRTRDLILTKDVLCQLSHSSTHSVI